MDKKELKKKRYSIQETLSRLENNFTLAKSQGNTRAAECAKKLIEFFENQLKSLKEQ